MTSAEFFPQGTVVEPQLLEALPTHHRVVAIILAVAMLIGVIELVRKRKLREEYSAIWTLTAIMLLALALEPRLLALFQQAIGAVFATNALFFGALVFLMLVALQFSVHLSKLTFRIKALSQCLALLEKDLETMEKSGRQQIVEMHPTPQAKVQRSAKEEATG